jgi:hypothetical protein
VGKTDAFSIEFVGTLSAAAIVSSGIWVTPLTQIIGNRNTMLIGSVSENMACWLSILNHSIY